MSRNLIGNVISRSNTVTSSISGILDPSLPYSMSSLHSMCSRSDGKPTGAAFELKERNDSSTGVDSHDRMFHSVLKQKNLNAARTLSHHPSKLDLIDDTTLTSLPLPPPPARLRRGDLASSHQSKGSAHSLLEIKAPAALDMKPWSTFGQESQLTTFVDADDNISQCSDLGDNADESEDPIVLVEDYMGDKPSATTAQSKLFRQKSLANFKKRICEGHTLTHESVRGSKRPIADDESRFHHTSPNEDLEAIFGKIPGSDKLRHCSLCDKPLYEISSIISNTTPTQEQKGNMERLYEELVCWECINVYEQFLSELYETELADAQHHPLDDNTTRKLLDIFNSIKETYGTDMAPPTKRQKKREFSDNLLNRLHHLSSMSGSSTTSEWFNNFRLKLRWRWSLDRLLPNQTHDKQKPNE